MRRTSQRETEKEEDGRGKVKSAKLQDCAGAAATERLRPGRELRSRAVDTFRPGWGPSTALPAADYLSSSTSQDKKVTCNPERLITFARLSSGKVLPIVGLQNILRIMGNPWHQTLLNE